MSSPLIQSLGFDATGEYEYELCPADAPEASDYEYLDCDETEIIYRKETAYHRRQGGRRIILATNVAETSLTVPGIGYVIDPGYARISRYSYRTKVQRLPIEAISQASANQRKGRCGRIGEGVCMRLYDEDDFNARPEFTDAEIRRTNLAAVILQMLQMKMGDIRHFPFVDKPDQRLINDGFKLLQELGAVNKQGKLTAIGRQLTRLPVDPRLGRMLLAALDFGCVQEVLIIASALSIQDPRERPAEKQQAADEKHRRFRDEDSDFAALINLWNYVEEQRQALSQNQFRKLCEKEFLSYLRLREWREIHHQLRIAVKSLASEQGKKLGELGLAGYDAVHRALLPGLLGNLGNKSAENDYLGARNRRFMIFPGSSQFKKKPKWLMAGELIETSRLYAHNVARIDPEWALLAAQHLVKRNYFEPHYSASRGQVMAFERVSLYGLVLVEKQIVNYSRIDPVVSREVFIRSALVEGKYADGPKGRQRKQGVGEFFKRNQAVLAELHDLEAKSRRRDIVADEQVVFEFYSERIPADVVNLVSFETWRKQAERDNSRLLHISRERLMQHDARGITEAQFPDSLAWQGMEFLVSYRFEPGTPDDGVSLHVPVSLLHLVPENRLQWLVPGILREKCIAMVKGLSKQWRKHFVPVPAFVDKALSAMQPDNTPLAEALALQLKRHTAVEVPAAEWAAVNLDDYYRFNIKVENEQGKLIDQGRDLPALREAYRDRVQESLQDAGADIEREGITAWDFGTLSSTCELSRGGVKIRAYPALVDQGDSVALKVLDNPRVAEYESFYGVIRLAILAEHETTKYLRKQLLKGKDMGLAVVNLGRREAVIDDLIVAAFGAALFAAGDRVLPRTEEDFSQWLSAGRSQLVAQAQEIEQIVASSLQALIGLRKQMKSGKNALSMAFAVGDLNEQIARLFYPGFLAKTPVEWLRQYPRYIKAMQLRLEKAPLAVQKDKLQIRELEPHWARYDALLEKEGWQVLSALPDFVQYRWMLEEFRISLFAQSVKTLMPVSAKRLDKQWQQVLEALH